MKLGLGQFPLSYGSCVTIQVSLEGLVLSVFPLLRILHPSLSIPWAVVTECKEEKLWFFTHTALYLKEPKTRLLFRGRATSAVRNHWERYRLSSR